MTFRRDRPIECPLSSIRESGIKKAFEMTPEDVTHEAADNIVHLLYIPFVTHNIRPFSSCSEHDMHIFKHARRHTF